MTPREVLREVFGYPEFRPGQERVIAAVLRGGLHRVAPLGAGKSLTRSRPASPGTVLVISPLIALMKDQVDALVRTGFRAALVNSTLSFEERRATLAALRRGELELVYLAPEALEGSLRSFSAASGSRSSRSTRPTAFPSGATTSGRPTGGCGGSSRSWAGCRCWRSPPPPRGPSPPTSSGSSAWSPPTASRAPSSVRISFSPRTRRGTGAARGRISCA
jgi:hypothetical protein